MTDNKRTYFYNKLIEYVDIFPEKEKNEMLLTNLINSISDECVTKFLSELYSFIQKIDNYTDFDELYKIISENFDKKLIMSVVNEACNLNKRAILFYEYYNIRKFGYITKSQDGSVETIDIIRKYLSLGASVKDIESFIDIDNTIFNERDKLIKAYLNTVIFSDSARDSIKKGEVLRLKA